MWGHANDGRWGAEEGVAVQEKRGERLNMSLAA